MFTTSVLGALLGYCLGFLGHRFTLGRDKRADFNRAAAPIRAWLIQERARPTVFRTRPSRLQLQALEARLTWWDRLRFRRAWQELLTAYDATVRQDPETGEPVLDDAVIKAGLERCLRYTQPR